MAKYLKLGTLGVYMALEVVEWALAIVSILKFKKGKWKQVKV